MANLVWVCEGNLDSVTSVAKKELLWVWESFGWKKAFHIDVSLHHNLDWIKVTVITDWFDALDQLSILHSLPLLRIVMLVLKQSVQWSTHPLMQCFTAKCPVWAHHWDLKMVVYVWLISCTRALVWQVVSASWQPGKFTWVLHHGRLYTGVGWEL